MLSLPFFFFSLSHQVSTQTKRASEKLPPPPPFLFSLLSFFHTISISISFFQQQHLSHHLISPPHHFHKGLTNRNLLSVISMEMEQHQNSVLGKRKHSEQENSDIVGFSLEDLNQDLLERVLSWLPTSSLFSVSSVCKRWKSAVTSASFRLACSQIPSRDPWFLMVDRHLDQSFAFDTAERNWLKNPNSPFLKQNLNCTSMIPVAASAGLVCFHNDVSGDFVISNPVNGSCRQLPSPTIEDQPLHAISMAPSYGNTSFYKLVLVLGELPNLSTKIYNSANDQWEEEITLKCRGEDTNNSMTCDTQEDETMYFLSKAGDVVTTNMQRSPSKQYSSVMITKNGKEIIYFLSSSGTIVACNLACKSFEEYPRLLPIFFEHSIDVVECRGEMLVVVLWEFLESATLRIWRFSVEDQCWRQVAAMPPSMSHELYGKKADINCAGSGDQILICVNSCEYSNHILCDLVANEWTELPKCFAQGEAKEFTSTFSFEPRIEAIV